MEEHNDTSFQIAGAISGGITDPASLRALHHAELYYEEIRKNHADVKRIAQNTGFTTNQILMIKNYLFVDAHELDGGYRRFDVSFEIAESWRRLAFDPENIKPHDITLLNHELMEMRLVNDGSSQEEAHAITSRRYDYAKQSAEYYQGIRQMIHHGDGQISGAISALNGNTH